MKPLLISLIVFACIFAGALLGMVYRAFLTEGHLSKESRGFVLTVGLELAGVIAAFVLALAVTGAQKTFNDQRSELIMESSNILLLHKILVDYGPESNEAREILRRSLVNTIDKYWPSSSTSYSEQKADMKETQVLYKKILSLKPQNESQRTLLEKALDISFSLEQSRDLLIMQQTRSIPLSFLIVMGLLVVWFIFIFFSLGIYAPSNSTVVFMLVLSALSVAIAFFIIIDLSLPFEGILRMPSEPLRDALSYIGK